jgi:hypothetical protein
MSPIKTEPARGEQANGNPSVSSPPRSEAGEARSQPKKDPELERRFRELVAVWQVEVAPLSSSTARVQHPAYREIIALGPAAVPLLLRELEQRPNHWFAALKSLTGIDPVPPCDRGQIGPMTKAWITWGKEHGFL